MNRQSTFSRNLNSILFKSSTSRVDIHWRTSLKSCLSRAHRDSQNVWVFGQFFGTLHTNLNFKCFKNFFMGDTRWCFRYAKGFPGPGLSSPHEIMTTRLIIHLSLTKTLIPLLMVLFDYFSLLLTYFKKTFMIFFYTGFKIWLSRLFCHGEEWLMLYFMK